jgi:signal recognition particle receptor subunit beta
MAALNPLTRELVFKVVFYGPGLGGKTTTLQYIHAHTKPEHRGKLVSLATPTDRTLYFDFLPLRVHRVRNMNVRLQLFTVPGQVYYTATRKLVLTGADGVVFVADSQAARIDANQESLEDLAANVAEHGRKLSTIPHTFHWNKRDLPDVVPMDDLDRRFNVFGAPALGTVATSGVGVYEGLERITRLVVEAYKADLPPGDKLGPLLDADDLGIAQAIRGLAESPVPRAPASARPGSSPGSGSHPATRIEDAHVSGPTAPSPPPPSSMAPTSSPPPLSAPPASAQLPHVEGVFSLASLWPEPEQNAVRRAEVLLAARDWHGAVLACDVLVTRVLASAAGLGGSLDAPRDPALVALLLGLDGRRYLEFRSMVRAARTQRALDLRAAYECLLFALEAGRARDRLWR